MPFLSFSLVLVFIMGNPELDFLEVLNLELLLLHHDGRLRLLNV